VSDLAAPAITAPSEFPARPVPATLDNSDPKDKLLLPGTYLSSWLIELVKLAQAGIEDGVLLTFIDSAGTFNLGADQIIYLRDLGVSNEVISTILEHDFELLAGLRPMPPATVAASQPAVQITLAARNAVPTQAPTQSAAPIARFNASTLQPVNEAPPSTSPAQVKGWSPGLSDAPARVESDGPEFTTTEELSSSGPPARSEQGRSFSEPRSFSPVREPYPVQLTDPIIVVRAYGPTPNLQVLELSP